MAVGGKITPFTVSNDFVMIVREGPKGEFVVGQVEPSPTNHWLESDLVRRCRYWMEPMSTIRSLVSFIGRPVQVPTVVGPNHRLVSTKPALHHL